MKYKRLFPLLLALTLSFPSIGTAKEVIEINTEMPVIEEIMTAEEPSLEEIVTEEEPVIDEIVTEEETIIDESVIDESVISEPVIDESETEALPQNSLVLMAEDAQNYLIPMATTASGTCGDSLTWTLSDSGTLTISGTGTMYDYMEKYILKDLVSLIFKFYLE